MEPWYKVALPRIEVREQSTIVAAQHDSQVRLWLFSYILTHDRGFAPNPLWGICSLALADAVRAGAEGRIGAREDLAHGGRRDLVEGVPNRLEPAPAGGRTAPACAGRG